MFRGMAFLFKIRDFFHPPLEKLKDAGIKLGDKVLDYGCGPGSFSIAAAELVGEAGKVFAVDIQPLAIKAVQRKAMKKALTNVETIHSDCNTELEGSTIDVALLLDVFHSLTNRNDVLVELQRILKPKGHLFFNDHHMNENEIISNVTEQGLFKLLEKKNKSFLFIKA